MKKNAWKLLLLSLAPLAVGWLFNVTIMIWSDISLLSSLVWYGLPLAELFFWYQVGRRCRARTLGYLPALALTHWVVAVEVAVYLWQFLAVSSEARNMELAGFSQDFNIFMIYTVRLARLFETQPNYIGQATTVAMELMGFALLVAAFSLGYLWVPKEKKTMKVLGITGPTGAGKTTALNALRALGAEVLDADDVYHGLLTDSEAMKAALVSAFGTDILDGEGKIDRRRLAGVVYPNRLGELNELTHPYIMEELDRRIEQARQEGRPAAAIDAIALMESGAGAKCDAVVSVLAPEALRVKRIMARDGIDEAYALRRVRAQPSDEFFRSHSDYVLENTETDTPETFGARAKALFERLL
ncbi:MAG: dephospho-CoA kinase [Pseudoflavonifractor sp.]|nr:dephospho-CoA kinase [Pseudoflavonifractor sp.]